VRNKYQRKQRKSNHKFQIVRGQVLMVQVPLPIAEVWRELQTQVEELTGQAGLQCGPQRAMRRRGESLDRAGWTEWNPR
jgi:hypothetical protein